MDLDFDIDQEYTHTHFYTNTVKDSKELCLVCMVEEDDQWDRYMTKCKHVFHTRCFRRWCGKKQSINCPLCGDIPEFEENMYCDGCKAFGHLTYADKCPIAQQEEMLIIFMDSKGSTPSKRKQKNKSKSNN